MNHRRMVHRRRRFSWLSDLGGIQNAVGEMWGVGFPAQPRLRPSYQPRPGDPVLDTAWFTAAIKAKVASHPDNRLEYPFHGEHVFDEPLVGVVRGDDPIFEEYKSIIGPHHLTPAEAMAWQAGLNGVAAPPASALAVVAFILPIKAETRRDNRASNDWVSERWAQTRLNGETFSQTIVREIVTFLMGRGIPAVAPDVTPMFRKKRYPRVGWASPWSHRHMAYAAGLGTFGMHDLFITEKGCAHRCGSFVVKLPLAPTRERPKDIHADCLQYRGFECLECAKRCPVGAITRERAHDKEPCYRRVLKALAYCNHEFHIFTYACGLCATGVPCEAGVPAAPRQRARRPAGAPEEEP